MNWEDAEMKLKGKPDGSFLVRDSSDPRYILSLSFRSQGITHHTRMEHYRGERCWHLKEAFFPLCLSLPLLSDFFIGRIHRNGTVNGEENLVDSIEYWYGHWFRSLEEMLVGVGRSLRVPFKSILSILSTKLESLKKTIEEQNKASKTLLVEGRNNLGSLDTFFQTLVYN